MTSATTSTRVERLDRARRWLDGELAGKAVPPLLVLIGLGDGAVLDALDERAHGTRVLCLEPDPRRSQAFLSAPDWQAWRQSGRLAYLCDPDYAGADQAWRIFPNGITVPMVLVHPDVVSGEATARAAQCLKRILYGVEANAEARRRFAPRYLVNSLRNLPAIAAGSNVRHLADSYRGMPAIIAGAGPSLDAAIDDLRALPNRGLLIAADTALRPLLGAGIAPHLVAALDPSQLNSRHLQSLPDCRDTWLVSESALDRQATAVFERRTFWFRAANHHPWPWFDEIGLGMGLLDVWGSVLTAAFQVARLAGCDPIVIIGADLSFTGGQPYARGTTYEFNWAEAVAAGHPLAAAWAYTANVGEPVADVRGGTTPTTGTLISVRDWMVAQAGRCGRRVINASGAGILFGDGIEQAPRLADALPHAVAIPPVSTFARRAANVRPSTIATRARSIRKALTSPSPTDPANVLLTQWREFSGEGFDATAVAAALDEAARSLETKRGVPAQASVIPWERGQGATGMAGLVRRLPEALGRMPGLLVSSEAVVAEPAAAGSESLSAAERATRLVQAWDVLARISDTVMRGDEDLRVQNPQAIGAGRVCSLYDWPEPIRWAVTMFEGLLGDTWPPPVSSIEQEQAYCARPLLFGPDQADRSRLPNAACACALLALEWLGAAGVSSRVYSPIAASLRADAMRIANAGGPAIPHGAVLAVETIRDRNTGDPDVRLSFSAAAVALMRTGQLSPESAGAIDARHTVDLATVLDFARIEAPALSAAIGTRCTRTPRVSTRVAARDMVVAPRVLTHGHGTDRLFIGYPTDAGVVCARLYSAESVLIAVDGGMRTHFIWPRHIGMELPYGKDGAVAWCNGLTGWPEIAPAYVMYRQYARDEVTIEELPVRPGYGQWWQGRLYWSCFSRLEGWQGLVSWAPGEEIREEAPGLLSWAVFPDGEGLVMQPNEFTVTDGFRRCLRSNGWRIGSRQPPTPVALGPYGAASSRAMQGSWTATTYPDIDVVRLESTDGRALSLACPCPLGAAWAGSSLFVSTLQAELLVFDHLAERIERVAARSISR